MVPSIGGVGVIGISRSGNNGAMESCKFPGRKAALIYST